jgi:ribosomal protein S18 acetylase RimI-like enzyme
MNDSSNYIHQQLDDATLLADVEQNFAEEMLYFSRTQPGGEIRTDNELTLFFTEPNGPNGVLSTRFTDTTTAHLHRSIDETLRYFRERGVHEIWWRVGPTASPANIAEYLQARGFTPRSTTQCMILLANDIQQPPSLPQLTISEVTDEAQLKLKCDLEMRGFSSSASDGQRYNQSYLQRGFGPGTPWHHYIGWLDDHAVGVSAIMLHNGVVGIYGVATPPEYRRRGIGSTLTIHAVRSAQNLGYPIITLSNTAMSAAIYRRLGFQNYCQLRHYGIVLTQGTKSKGETYNEH